VITLQDIASALKSAIKDWEVTKELNTMQTVDTAKVHQWDGAVPTAKQPVAHTIFNYVRDNPGMLVAQYVEKLSEKGLIRGSISSYLYQMVDTNLLYADAERKLYTRHTEYKTLKQLKPTPKAKKAKKPVVAKPKPVVAPEPVRTVHVQQKVDTVDQDVERILSMLNVRTAHKLREALNNIFSTHK
jgi:hypothetical protein